MRKMKILAVIPLWGAIILLFWLFIKAVKQEINRKKFRACFVATALIGFLSILAVVLLLGFVSSLNVLTEFVQTYGMLVAIIVGGYIMNLFAFVKINKHWTDLENVE